MKNLYYIQREREKIDKKNNCNFTRTYHCFYLGIFHIINVEYNTG